MSRHSCPTLLQASAYEAIAPCPIPSQYYPYPFPFCNKNAWCPTMRRLIILGGSHSFLNFLLLYCVRLLPAPAQHHHSAAFGAEKGWRAQPTVFVTDHQVFPIKTCASQLWIRSRRRRFTCNLPLQCRSIGQSLQRLDTTKTSTKQWQFITLVTTHSARTNQDHYSPPNSQVCLLQPAVSVSKMVAY